MKKLMKKISALGLALTVLLSNLSGVGAYDQDILTSNDITVPNNIYLNSDNYIGLTNELKDNAAVVNHQYVTISQELFEKLDKKSDENNTYVTTQNKIIDEKYLALQKEKTKVEELKAISDKPGATQEQIDAYNTANAAYTTLAAEYRAYVDNVAATVTSNYEAYKKLIPSYDNNNWKQLTLSESTTTSNKYKLESPGNREYFVLWVKVTLNGKDYYNYQLYCNKEEPETYVCEYKNGKWYNKSGKEVTEAEYKADCETPETYVCEYKDGKWYNSKGKEVTEAEYKADCEEPVVNVCKIVDGKYYDNNGFEVTKEEYEKACTTPKNPKTGSNVSYIYAVLISLVAISSYAVVRKARKFSR
ncbi:MAG: hypothetical protein E7157_05785 [Lactobacillales bacterium]|nr:hypothetical protein [Lactobacillales bacterium]